MADDYINDIINATPESLRQIAAGVATIPSETGRLVAMLANPRRAYRQITDTALPEDSTGVPATIQGYSDRYNAAVNSALNLKDPSFLDDTGNATLRMLGGALPNAPSSLFRGALSAAPAIVRGGVRLAESLTPVTFTSAKGVARAGPVAANTLIPTAAGVAAEALTEKQDPTATIREYDEDGNLSRIVYPAVTPGVGRIAAREIGESISEHPVGAALGGGAALLFGAMARRSINKTAAVREASEQSDVIKPIDAASAQPNVPLDGPILNARTGVQEVTQDANIVAKEMVEKSIGQADPRRAASVQAMLDLGNDSSHKSRVQQARAAGVIDTPEGPVHVPSIDRTAEELTNASRGTDPELKRRVDDRIELENELDNRLSHQKRATAMRQNGASEDEIVEAGHLVRVDSTRPQMVPGTTTQARIAGKLAYEKDVITPRAQQWNLPDTDLEQRVQAARADATTVPWVKRYHDYHEGMLGAVVKFKALGQNEASRMLKVNPHYRHTNNFIGPKSPFTTRLRGHQEGPEFGGDVWDAAREYTDHALDFAYKNMRRRETIEAIRDGMAANPSLPRWLGQSADPREIRKYHVQTTTTGLNTPPVPMTKADIKLSGDIQRYKVGDDLVETEIHNKSLFNSLENMPRHTKTMFGWMRSLAESSMTGKIATLMGQPFALANATMGSIFAAVTRPKGLSFGALDKGAQALTGGRIGIRGDPTIAAMVPYTAAKNVGVVMARAVSDALYNSIAASGMLAKIPNARGLADRLGQVFRESNYAQQFRGGAGEVNTMGGEGIDTSARSSFVEGMERTEQARVVSPNDPSSVSRYLRTIDKNVNPVAVKVGWRLLGDIQNAIASSPQSYAWQSNINRRTKGLTPEQAYREVQTLSAEVRQLLGDPAMRGTGLRDFQTRGSTGTQKVVGRVLDATPYGNIGVQATARLMQAFRRDFVGTSAGMGIVLGEIAILPLVNAWRLDKERTENGLSPLYLPYELAREGWHQGRFIVGHIQGVDPSLSPAVRSDPLMAPFISVAREVVLYALGISGNRQYEPNSENDIALGALERYADERRWINVNTSLINAQPLNQFPPAMVAGFAATGIELPGVVDLIGRGGAQPINTRGLGGYDETRQSGGLIGKRLEAIFQGLFPGLGATMGGMLNAGAQEARGGGSFVHGATDNVLTRARDRAQEFNGVLWDQPRKRATNDATAAMVNEREATLRAIQTNIQSIKAPGTIGSGRFREQDLGGGGGRAGVQDQPMSDLMGGLNRAWSHIQPQTAERSKLREELIAISQRPNMDIVQRRRAENVVAEKIVEVNRRLLNQYYILEDNFSNMYGRRIRLDKLDPSKPITQFPELVR